MGATSFLWQAPEIPWKSEWRVDFERRSKEAAMKPRRILSAVQIQARNERANEPVPRPPSPRSRYKRVIPTTFCSGCNKGFTWPNKKGICNKCLRARPKCACGRTIYLGIEGNMCKECYHKANCQTCALCPNILNRTNVYGLCKPCYSKHRRSIHQDSLTTCGEDGCAAIVRKTNSVGRCRLHSRRLHAARAKENKKAAGHGKMKLRHAAKD